MPYADAQREGRRVTELAERLRDEIGQEQGESMSREQLVERVGEGVHRASGDL